MKLKYAWYLINLVIKTRFTDDTINLVSRFIFIFMFMIMSLTTRIQEMSDLCAYNQILQILFVSSIN